MSRAGFLSESEHRDEVCGRCHKFTVKNARRGTLLGMLGRRMCNCDPPPTNPCTCACGDVAPTHVLDCSSHELVPWCAKKGCKGVAALSYRWPDADLHRQLESCESPVVPRACAHCGHAGQSGPWTAREHMLQALQADFRFAWVDHWCTQGLRDIPKLRAVYKNASKVVVPLPGESPMGVLPLVCALCFILPLIVLVRCVLVSFLYVSFRAQDVLAYPPMVVVTAMLSAKRKRQFCRIVAFAPVALVVLVTAALVYYFWSSPLVMLGVSFFVLLLLIEVFKAACCLRHRASRSKRFWLRLESVYARTAAVLTETQGSTPPRARLSRSLRWRMGIERNAGELPTWMPVGPDWDVWQRLRNTDAFSVSDKFLAMILARLDTSAFLHKAKRAHLQAPPEDQTVPRWLPQDLHAKFNQSLMGTVIAVKDMAWALEIRGENCVALLVDGDTNFGTVMVRLEEDSEGFALVRGIRNLSIGMQWLPDRFVVRCRALCNIKFA